MEWQPIETAPKDGTWFVALAPDSTQDSQMPKPFVFTTCWVKEQYAVWEPVDEDTQKRRIDDHSHWYGHEDPTHWQPLPSYPSQDAQ